MSLAPPPLTDDEHALRARRLKAVRLIACLVAQSGSAADAVSAVEAMDPAAWHVLTNICQQPMPSSETKGLVHRALIFRAALEAEMGPYAAAVLGL